MPSIMSKIPDVIFVLGGPGSGKGTVCTKLSNRFKFVHLSAGDLLREERDRNAEFAKLFNEHVQKGQIVPVAYTCGLLEKAMKESKANTFLIDGFPRNQDNLDGWNKQIGSRANIRSVLFLECDDNILIKRCLGRGRHDDSSQVISKRIKTYYESTIPIVKHYDNLNLLKKIDASKPPDEVFTQVESFIQKLNI